jgi:hypothetical protein
MSQGKRPARAARLVHCTILALVVSSSPFPPTAAVLADGPPAAPSATPPPLPDDRLGIRTAPLYLLSRPDVRAEVGLDASQAEDAGRTLARLYQDATALRGKSGPEILAGRRAIDEAERSWIATRLNEPQRRRLIEIDLQWEGPSALISRPVVADHLGLSPEQRSRLTKAIAERDGRRAQGEGGRTAEQHLAEQALALLSREQRTRWRAMLGRPCPFTPLVARLESAPTR